MLDQLPVVALDVVLSKLDFYSKLAVYSTSKELRMNVLVDDIWEGELLSKYGFREDWLKLSNFLIAVNNTEFEDVRDEVMSSFPKKLAKKLPDEAARLNLLRFGFTKMSGFKKYEENIIDYSTQISRIYDCK
ncbi:unnamed protein product [Oikopleura dioica]|uniref:F-box domain-containing protein n=1 Tax=Oikopleura dioica TaxID=34765 RepID=E4X536_OIKDI|nr:unnamed protein product [Oikopleura dioica]